MATFPRKSQLSKTLVEVLMDDSVLPYFMEYMQKQNATNLLNFWLTAETFRLSTINRLRINSMSRLKTSKVENTSSNMEENKAVNSNSETLCIRSSLVEPNIVGNSNRAADQLQSLDKDNEFGDFTRYEPESSAATDATARNSGNVLLLCDKCGHLINPLSPKKDVCDHCGQTFTCSNGQTIDRTFNTGSCGPTHNIASNSIVSGLQNGINQDDISSHSNMKNTKGNMDCVDDPGTLKGSRSSKVTFDLKPDFDNEQREFCRRRTRSIVIDAVSIYSKYISLEASHPIGLEESVRRQIESKWHKKIINPKLLNVHS